MVIAVRSRKFVTVRLEVDAGQRHMRFDHHDIGVCCRQVELRGYGVVGYRGIVRPTIC